MSHHEAWLIAMLRKWRLAEPQSRITDLEDWHDMFPRMLQAMDDNLISPARFEEFASALPGWRLDK